MVKIHVRESATPSIRPPAKAGQLQQQDKTRGLRGQRALERSSTLDVPLFLELQFLDVTVVEELELHTEAPETTVFFCSCIRNQTSASIVAQAAADANASLTTYKDTECILVDTSRQYDFEAEDIFGPGFLSLEVHVTQRITVISEQAVPPETVTDIIASGYKVSTGGQREFLNCLNQSDRFRSVLSVELRRGLTSEGGIPSAAPTPETAPPTSSPTLNRTSEPTTEAPTVAVTKSPSARPTSSPSMRPSMVPTVSPTLQPSKNPSSFPSDLPTGFSSAEPTIDHFQYSPSKNPKTGSPTRFFWECFRPSTGPPLNPPSVQNSVEISEDNQQLEKPPTSDPLLIAAIAGATATVIVSCIFAGCIWWRKTKNIPKRRSKPKYALTSRDGQLGKMDPDDMIPGFVELDQRSLAETTLGDRTAGRPRATTSTIQPKKISHVTSFDENSLYTTPLSLQRIDDASSYHQTHNGPSILASQIVRPKGFDEAILLPLSDSTTTSSDSPSSFGQLTGRHSTNGSLPEYDVGDRNSASSKVKRPIDVDTQALYEQTGRRLEVTFDQINDHAKATRVSRAIAEGSTAYDIDTWSCESVDFDRGSDFYIGEARSRSPSHSSRSTAKVKNLSNAGHNRKGQESAKSGDSESARLYMEIKRGHESPPNQTKDVGSRRPPTPWSSWNSIFQDKSAGKRSAEKGSEYQSPLSKLLDSVTQAVTPLQSTRSIPAVTPEETESDIDQPTDTSLSREDDSTLLGLQFKDDTSASSGSTGSPNPWLLEKLEQSLGPKSATADLESLSGKSNLSIKSPGKNSRAGAESMASFGSQKSYRSGQAKSETSFAPRTLEHDLKRLGKQLAALDADQASTSSAGVSSITGTSMTKSSAPSSKTRSETPKVNRKKKIVVTVPPGKLGVILANRHDGKGTVVSEIRETSPLFRILSPGDKLIGIDNDDVTNMVVSQITSLVASRADRERRLAVITSVTQQSSK